MSKSKTMQTGMETANHWNQEGGGCMLPMATTFCGDEIGEAIPPTLAAIAIPMIKALAYVDFGGWLRRIGEMREKQRTGAATFEIHIEANVETNMLVKMTEAGLLPARPRTAPASDLAMLCLLRAAARENPPRRSMITGPNMSEKIFLAASFDVIRMQYS